MGNAPVKAKKAWLFSRFVAPGLQQPPGVDVTTHLEHAAGPKATTLSGTDEAAWNDAAVYQLNIPASAASRHLILDIHYVGDAARLYVGGKLFDHNIYTGDPFAVALWRIPASQWPDIRLKVLPYSDAQRATLPDHLKAVVAAEKAAGSLDEVTVSAADQLELSITPP